MWGLLHACTGVSADTLIERHINAPLSIPSHPNTTELTLSLPPGTPANAARVAMHDASMLMRRSGLDLAEVLTNPPAEAEEEAEEEGAGAEAAAADEEQQMSNNGDIAANGGDGSNGGATSAASSDSMAMGSARQMLSPPFLNMVKLRTAPLPGVSAHGSARGLATFYAGIANGKLLPPALVDELVAHGPPSRHMSGVRWAAGFQLGDAKDSSGRSLTVLGHGAPGGTLGLCVPEVELAFAVTASKLSPKRTATIRIVEVMLRELGLKLDTEAAGLLRDL